uniref:Uncharacterized protein n=1 Tax=Atrato Denso-like virus 1 TaxID=2689333 RepID=A0A6B9KNR8_9VIRU|nr:hypothetical protein [Atrato Denso-like virus 1]QHA33818.1 hypothetical protein [Atrato Denso-like virus 1]
MLSRMIRSHYATGNYHFNANSLQQLAAFQVIKNVVEKKDVKTKLYLYEHEQVLRMIKRALTEVQVSLDVVILEKQHVVRFNAAYEKEEYPGYTIINKESVVIPAIHICGFVTIKDEMEWIVEFKKIISLNSTVFISNYDVFYYDNVRIIPFAQKCRDKKCKLPHNYFRDNLSGIRYGSGWIDTRRVRQSDALIRDYRYGGLYFKYQNKP